MMNSYDPVLVMTSFVISILACWTALELSCRVHAQRSSKMKAIWLGSGAFTMGLGIWAMHYIGMLALRMGMPVLYHWPTVVLSLLAAVFASAVALNIVGKPTMSWLSTVAGGLVMGSGIAGMHYIGMSAMHVPCAFDYSRPLVALSLVLAVGISMVALRLCFSTKQDGSSWSLKKIGSALLMGLAVPTMHYVGMAAVQMRPMIAEAMPAVHDPLELQISQLGTFTVVVAVILFISFALLLASFNRDTLAVQLVMDQARSEHDQLNEYQQRLIKAYRQNGVGAWEWDPVTDCFSVDPAIRTIYGVDAHESEKVPRRQLLDMLHPEDVGLMRERWTAALATTSRYENEYRIVHRGGVVRRCRSVATVARHPDGTPSSVFGMSWDVTDEHAKQEDYAEQARRFYLTLEAIGDAVLSVDLDERILYANPVACQLTGWSKEECIGKHFTEVFMSEDEAAGEIRRSAVARCLELGDTLLSEGEILLSRTGARYNIQKHVNLVGSQGSAVVTFRDITVELRLKRELEVAATHDVLTGLPNRVAFDRLLQHVWKKERDGDRVHCLALLDLDRFKLVNDTAGHLAGDALLQKVVDAVKPLLPAGDCLARMGGDEFLLLLRDTTEEGALSLCHTVLRTFEDLHFIWQQRSYTITASLGLVFLDQKSASLEAVTSQADVALYTSKRNGRNRLSVYDADSGEAAGHLQEMEAITEIRLALEEDRFELHAQPIVSLRSEDADLYFELLVRMRDRTGALVLPLNFIPAAERYGMMQSLDRWVIGRALAMHAKSAPPDRMVRFAINLSADSLSDPTLWSFVYEQFRLTGVPFSCITFEVTESGMISNFGTAKRFLEMARSAGCRIALDDFGTGMSSLSYLKQFPPNVIKIDGSFVRNLLRTPLDQSIIQAISQIAHTMGADTIAECAEDMETVDLLAVLDVDYVQGWATGKPEPLTPLLQRMLATQRVEYELGCR